MNNLDNMKDIYHYAWRMMCDADIGAYAKNMWENRPEGLEWEYDGMDGKYIILIPDDDSVSHKFVSINLVDPAGEERTILKVPEEAAIGFDYNENEDTFTMEIYPVDKGDVVVSLPLRFKFTYTVSVPVTPKCDEDAI